MARSQWHNLISIVIAGMGIFTDAYDMYCVSFVTKLLGRIYYQVDGEVKPGTLPPSVTSTLYAVAFCGSFLGQLFFSWIGDTMGKKKVYNMTLMTMIICTFGSGLSFGHRPKHVIATLCFFRFWLGFGMGGDYLLSTSIMSKLIMKKSHGAFIFAVFAMQGIGFLAGGIFTMIVAAIFKAKYDSPSYAVDPYGSTVPQADYIWRIVLMAGALPAALSYYWRMKMSETAHFAALVAEDTTQAATEMSNVLRVKIQVEPKKEDEKKFGFFSTEYLRRYGLHLLGTAITWFCLDMTFYSQNLFQKDILSSVDFIPPAETMNALEEVYLVARAQTIMTICSTLPGYLFTVLLVDRMGRFAIQLIGFFFMAVFVFVAAFPYDYWIKEDKQIVFMLLYSLTFFFANFGPNAIVFIVPEEIFPARFRSICIGISSTAGNFGAMVASYGFMYLAQNKDKSKAAVGYPAGIGVKNSLIVLGVINTIAFLFTFLVHKAKGNFLKKMSCGKEREAAAEVIGES